MKIGGLHYFSPKVTVRTEDGRHNVSNVEAGAEELIKWPTAKWQQMAVRCGIEALNERATPQEFRRLFKLAAREAGVYLGDGDD